MTGHREALLEGAISCIHENGYARTTARDIVTASGTNLASIGYHYGSKGALLRAAISESFQRWYMPLIEAIEDRDIGDIVSELLAGLDEHRWLLVAHLEAIAEASRDEELRRFIAARYGAFRDALAARLGGGAGAAEQAARIIALLDGTVVQWLLEVDGEPDPHVLLRGIERPAAA